MTIPISIIINELIKNKCSNNVSEFARLCEVSEGSVRNYTSGNRTPKYESLMKMTEVFKIKDFNFWVTGKESDQEDSEELRAKLDKCEKECADLKSKLDFAMQLLNIQKEAPPPSKPPGPASRVPDRQGQPLKPK